MPVSSRVCTASTRRPPSCQPCATSNMQSPASTAMRVGRRCEPRSTGDWPSPLCASVSGFGHGERVAAFLEAACPDADVRGPSSRTLYLNTAMRLLTRHPEVAGDSLYTSVVCGDLARGRTDPRRASRGRLRSGRPEGMAAAPVPRQRSTLDRGRARERRGDCARAARSRRGRECALHPEGHRGLSLHRADGRPRTG